MLLGKNAEISRITFGVKKKKQAKKQVLYRLILLAQEKTGVYGEFK